MVQRRWKQGFAECGLTACQAVLTRLLNKWYNGTVLFEKILERSGFDAGLAV